MDWRASLKKNQFRTTLVVATFILLYLALGLLIDLAIYADQYPSVPLGTIFWAMLTLQLVPYATGVTGGVALVAIWLTFIFSDKLMLLGTQYQEVTAASQEPSQRRLYNIVEELKVAAGLRYMPKVFIIDADYMNAFASGYSEKSAMVAITRGLLQKLDRDELQAVMAHEISHIRHMDIKLTLFASVLTNIMLIVLDSLFWTMQRGSRRQNQEGSRLIWIILLLRVLLPLLTVLLTLYLSRTREYMADAGSVELTRDNQPLARALQKIHQDYADHHDEYSAAAENTAHENVRREAYILDPCRMGVKSASMMSEWFSTHPPLAKRLAALGIKQQS